jgi:hypothetical protein
MVDYRDFEEERLREFDSFGGGGVCLIRIIEGCHNE